MDDLTDKRFVILHHTGHGPQHWDLMLERQGSLTTWRLYHDPQAPTATERELFKIGDHRLAYLDYEGPLSADRGEVRRVCRGSYHLLEKTPQMWRVTFDAPPLDGTYQLSRLDGPRWLLRREGG